MDKADPSQRIDRWLWHARFARTRSLAQKLVRAGSVRVNRLRVTSPSHRLRCGNVLTIALHGKVRIIKVEDFSEKRGPFSQALLLYSDLSPIESQQPANRPLSGNDGLQRNPRPDRKARRDAIRLKQNFAGE